MFGHPKHEKCCISASAVLQVDVRTAANFVHFFLSKTLKMVSGRCFKMCRSK